MPNHIYNEFLYAEVEKYGLSNSVEFKGVVSDNELDELYQKSFGFINASLHEGFCIPVLEALYYGLNIFVQKGHAAEELQSTGMQLLDFNKITNFKITKLLSSYDNVDFVNKVLGKNTFNNWLNLFNFIEEN
jgi:glycosyltransferase involved in cell wall biosynthesis